MFILFAKPFLKRKIKEVEALIFQIEMNCRGLATTYRSWTPAVKAFFKTELALRRRLKLKLKMLREAL